jgi:hypothetical protein
MLNQQHCDMHSEYKYLSRHPLTGGSIPIKLSSLSMSNVCPLLIMYVIMYGIPATPMQDANQSAIINHARHNIPCTIPSPATNQEKHKKTPRQRLSQENLLEEPPDTCSSRLRLTAAPRASDNVPRRWSTGGGGAICTMAGGCICPEETDIDRRDGTGDQARGEYGGGGVSRVAVDVFP